MATGRRLMTGTRTTEINLQVQPRNIIVVDADPASRQNLSDNLTHLGFAHHVAENGVRAIELMLQNPAEVIVLNWALPDTSGVELCNQIRELPDGDLPMIVMLDLESKRRDLTAALKAGVDDYLDHDYSLETLSTRLSIAMKSYRNRVLLRETEKRYHILFINCGDYILLFDPKSGTIVDVNQAAIESLSYSEEELVGSNVDNYFHGFSPVKHAQTHEDSKFPIECAHVTKSGTVVPVEMRVALVSLNGKPVVQAHCRDVSDRKINEARLSDYATQLQQENQNLEKQSFADQLTGVSNRRWFDNVMNREVGRIRRSSDALSLIMIDVDHFKKFNDHHKDHQEGDACLRKVAQEVQRVLFRSNDTVARYGGEEFAIILPDTAKEGAMNVAERARAAIEALAIPHETSPVAGVVTISLGVTTITGADNSDVRDVIAAADHAMYQAKSDGRNRVVFAPPKTQNS